MMCCIRLPLSQLTKRMPAQMLRCVLYTNAIQIYFTYYRPHSVFLMRISVKAGQNKLHTIILRPSKQWFVNLIIYMFFSQVFLTVKGLRGKIPKTRLTKKAGSVRKNSKVAFRFSKGSTHLFKIHGPEIGDIKSVIIEVKIVDIYEHLKIFD